MDYYIPQNELHTPQNELTFFISWYVKRLDKSIVRTPFFNRRESPPHRGWDILPENERGAKERGRFRLGVRGQGFLSKDF